MFPKYPKTLRYENLRVVITEKIDGTNGLIEISPDGVRFGSRNCYLNEHKDNYGFFNFFSQFENRIMESFSPEYDGLVHIYGEWFGAGIQRTYGLKEKYFMPFSPYWANTLIEVGVPNIVPPYQFYAGKMDSVREEMAFQTLKEEGSQLVPGWKRPEGIIIHYLDNNLKIKRTLDKA